jgi:biopolymer transport protein ExbB/TolQ
MRLSFLELWAAMGPLARGVILLLVAMSFASIAIAIERYIKLARATRESRAFLAAWRTAVSTTGVAAGGVETTRFPHSYLAHLVHEATRVIGADGDDPGRWLEPFDRTARRLIVASTIDLKRGLGFLATVASSAPFVGLFGTVVGIVGAFHAIGVSGQGGLGSVSAGIAEALVATAFGIMVAIPAVWFFNDLTQRVQRIAAELECVAEELAVAALDEARRADGRSRHAVGR